MCVRLPVKDYNDQKLNQVDLHASLLWVYSARCPSVDAYSRRTFFICFDIGAQLQLFI